MAKNKNKNKITKVELENCSLERVLLGVSGKKWPL